MAEYYDYSDSQYKNRVFKLKGCTAVAEAHYYRHE